MNKQSQCNGEMSPLLTCGNCNDMIRSKQMQDEVICVPQLKIMPANNSLPCDLRSDQQYYSGELHNNPIENGA